MIITEKSKIKNLLSSNDETFQSVYNNFFSQFSEFKIKCKILNKLFLLLISNTLNLKQRLNTIFILFQRKNFDSKSLAENPYLSSLLDYFWEKNNKNGLEETNFMFDLFLQIENHTNSTAEMEIKKIKINKNKFTIKELKEKLKPVEKLVKENTLEIDPSLKSFFKKNKVFEETDNSISLDFISPEFVTIFPEINANESDLEWIFLDNLNLCSWEHNLYEKNIKQIMRTEIILNMVFLVKKDIVKAEECFLENFLQVTDGDNVKNLIEIINFYVKPNLTDVNIETNKNIFYLILLFCYKNNEKLLESYLNEITKIVLTEKSISLVTKLLKNISLPKNFISEYIYEGIKKCEKNKNQNEILKAFFEFLRGLFIDKKYFVYDTVVEVQRFCLNFSKIREAVLLYKFLKNDLKSKNRSQ